MNATRATSTGSSRTQVVIVGAGPVGLALAIELGSRGVRCLVIERNARVGHAPRAKTTHVRTREHMRRWGIAGKLREASPLGVSYPSNILFVTRLGGRELARFENAFCCAPGRNPLYAEHAQWIPQYTVEEVMRAHAASLPTVEIRFGCEMLDHVQAIDGVDVRLRDAARGESEVQAAYLVGADGARSPVRDAIGAKMHGRYGLSRNYNIVFRAPGLAAAHLHGPALMYWQLTPDMPSLIGPMERHDTWFFMPTQVPEGLRRGDIDGASLIRQSTGIDLPYEVLSTDEWVASELLADRYRDRRVFLAGDACHLHPPFGGFGMNMGISDGVDLGWKLAAVLQGWGGEDLLESYEAERRPVHKWVLEEAVANHSVLSNQLAMAGLEDDSDAGDTLRRTLGARIEATKLREFVTLGVVLGLRYEDSPVVVPDGSPAPPADFVNYVPSSRPGGRAPHAWLHDGSSLFDHFGAGFTLLASRGAERGVLDDAVRQAAERRVPLKVLAPTEGAIASLYPTAYTLIRPDQHIAWRGDAWPGAALLGRVTGQAAPPSTGSAA